MGAGGGERGVGVGSWGLICWAVCHTRLGVSHSGDPYHVIFPLTGFYSYCLLANTDFGLSYV